jgi:hypothetical protein
VSWKEAHPVVSFLLAEKNETLGRELTEVITHYLESRQAKDQGRNLPNLSMNSY